jgi:MT0933-like antitoxin protein
MGLMDKLRGVLGQHSDKADTGIERAGDAVDDRTSSKYADRVDQGQDAARDHLSRPDGEAEPPG